MDEKELNTENALPEEKKAKNKAKKKGDGASNKGAGLAIKICALAIAALLVVGGIVLTVILLRGDEADWDFSLFDNGEEIDGSDKDHTKLY